VNVNSLIDLVPTYHAHFAVPTREGQKSTRSQAEGTGRDRSTSGVSSGDRSSQGAGAARERCFRFMPLAKTGIWSPPTLLTEVGAVTLDAEK
jgi:hypothetical protein